MNTLMHIANQNHLNRKYKEASVLYEKILESEPDHLEALIGLSDCFYNLSQSRIYREKTIELVKKIIEIAPAVSKPYTILSLLAANESFSDQKFYAEKAIELDPNSPEALCCYGLLLLRENRYTEAAGYLEKAVELEPKMYLANYNLLFTYSKVGDIKKQLKQSKVLLYLKPTVRNLTLFSSLYLANNRFLYLILLVIPLLYIWLPNILLFATHVPLVFLTVYGIISALKHKDIQHLKKNILLTLLVVSLDIYILIVGKIL